VRDADKQLARKHEEDRLKDRRMSYYNMVYKNSKRWTGNEDISDSRIIIYCEQGFGDIIHMARYIPQITVKELWLHCPKELHRLWIDETVNTEISLLKFLDKVNPELPEHDYHILSLSLPFLLGEEAGRAFGTSHTEFPYFGKYKPKDLSEYSGLKIGICWEGSPTHEKNDQRNCPLRYFKSLQKIEKEDRLVHLFSLQKYIHDPELTKECEDMFLLGVELSDFRDTAELITAMDMVVTVDTAVVHLAGAIGKKTHLVLGPEHDDRWGNGTSETRWYKHMKIWRAGKTNRWPFVSKTSSPNWRGVFDKLVAEISKTHF
jgi:hypothetical protein